VTTPESLKERLARLKAGKNGATPPEPALDRQPGDPPLEPSRVEMLAAPTNGHRPLEQRVNTWKLALTEYMRELSVKENDHREKGIDRTTYREWALGDLKSLPEREPALNYLHPPKELSATEIEEELSSIVDFYLPARREDAGYEAGLPAVNAGEAPIIIPWEGFDAAIAANEAYLARTPVIDKLCYSSAVSMITGGKHAGKSTLARWMAMCVVKGWPFLKREVVQGPVCYIASDDETMPARQELLRLGWNTADPLRFLASGAAGVDDRIKFLELLTRDIREFGALLVVLDMMFDFVDIRDELSYAGTREAVGRIQKVATDTGAHIVAIHHAPKHAQTGDAAVTALGSQGLAARVSPIILVRRFGPGVHSVTSTAVRDPRGEALTESRLHRNEDGSVTLGGAFKNYMLAEVYVERIQELLQAEEGAEMTASDVAQAIDIAYEVARASLSAMYKNGLVERLGAGKKGKPFRYALISHANGTSETEFTPQGRGVVGEKVKEEWSGPSRDQGMFGYKD